MRFTRDPSTLWCSAPPLPLPGAPLPRGDGERGGGPPPPGPNPEPPRDGRGAPPAGVSNAGEEPAEGGGKLVG